MWPEISFELAMYEALLTRMLEDRFSCERERLECRALWREFAPPPGREIQKPAQKFKPFSDLIRETLRDKLN